MRILFVSTLYEPFLIGGAERVVQTVAEGLVSEGHECVVVTVGTRRKREARVINGVTIHYVPIRNVYMPFQGTRPGGLRRAFWHVLDSFNPGMGATVGAILDEERPEIVNTHNIAGFSVAVWKEIKGRRLPLVHTLHDQYLLCPRSTMFRDGANCTRQCTVCKLYSKPRRRLSCLPDVVIGVSRFILDRHVGFGYFEGTKQAVVYNAYEHSSRVPKNRDRALTNGPLRFGFLGRLHPTKGVEELVEAFLSLPVGTAELWIGGKGENEYEVHLKRRAGQRPDIHWLGFVEAEELLGQVDVLVIPSLWHDTAPRVVQEALAWGLPIIAARRGGLPELLSDSVGWTFEPGEPDSLRATLNTCLRHRSNLADMKTAALTNAQRFSHRAMLDGYLAAYDMARSA